MPDVRLTSGVFPVPAPEGDEGVSVAVLLNSTLPEAAAVAVRVERITPQGEKETLYDQRVTVPAQGGRDIPLDPGAVAGQMLEVTLVLPSEGLDPSVALVTGSRGANGANGGHQRSLTLWVSPRDFVPVAPAPPNGPEPLTTGLFLLDDQRDNLSVDWTYTLTLWVSHFGPQPASLPFSVRSAREAWGLMGPIPVGEGELNPPPGGATSFSMEAPQGGILEVNVDAAAGLVPSVVVARRMPGSPNQTRLWISPGRFTRRPGSLVLHRHRHPRSLLETETTWRLPGEPAAPPPATPAAPAAASAASTATSAPSTAAQGGAPASSAAPTAPPSPARSASRRFGRGR